MTLSLLGPVDVLATEVVAGVLLIEFLLLGIVLVNLFARYVAHRRAVRQAREAGADGMARNRFLEATNLVLLLGGFYYLTVEYHGGMVFTVLAIGLFVTDFFEFEARLVEARADESLELPKAAIVSSALVAAYIAYQALFFAVRPIWEAIV